MKKIIRTLGLACLAGLFAVSVSSCKKTEDKTTSVALVMEETEDFFPGGERAYINFLAGGITNWNANDQVYAYNVDPTFNPTAYQNSTVAVYEAGASAEGNQTATFYGPSLGTLLSDGYFFFYPRTMATGTLGAYNVDTFNVAKTQYYTGKYYNGVFYTTVDPLAMPLGGKNASLATIKVSHLFGYLRIYVKGSKAVESVVLTDPNHGLTGKMVARISNVDKSRLKNIFTQYMLNTPEGDAFAQSELANYVFNTAEGGLAVELNSDGNEITLDCSDNPVQLDGNDAKPFIFAVRPGALDNGFVVRFNFTDNTYADVTSQQLLDEIAPNLPPRTTTMRPGAITNLSYGPNWVYQE